MQTVVYALMGPLLVALATLAARRWDERVAGLVSALPAIAAPVLLIDAHAHGAMFAARAATGTVLGLVSLSAFAAVYGRVARAAGWRRSLLAGWLAAALSAAVARWADAGLPAAVLAAGTSLWLAHRSLAPVTPEGTVHLRRRSSLALRVVLTAGVVVGLAAVAGAAGPVAAGILTALPVLASVLAVVTHREQGAAAVCALLRGMLAGMAGFGLFCATVAVLIERTGIGPAFAMAAVAAVAVQATALRSARRALPHPPSVHLDAVADR